MNTAVGGFNEARLCDGRCPTAYLSEADMNLIWKILGCVALLSMLVLVLSLLTMHALAVSLSITGHSAGSGILSMNYSGDELNVSILQNGTAWVVNATGMV